MPTKEQQREKLIGLLKELFQLDQPDLDFGFYKIMHAKAKEVTAFLENDLLKIVEEKFGESNAAKVAQLQKAYEDAVAQAKSFGAADPEQTVPVTRARAALEAAKDTSRAEGEVYDHLYRFFERYYDAGDFMSRRYLSRETSSKAAPYAVPYDGSEVYLHWANKDQYYIKTTEYLTNFTFEPTKASEVREEKADLFRKTEPAPMPVHFRVVSATEGEHGNIKASDATKRYFILHKDDPVAIENGGLIVRFEYRPDPDKTGQDATWQAKRNEETVAGILEALGKLDDARAKEYSAILKVPAPTDKQKNRPLLAKYVARYTARNTMDYFIHKDLGGFLRRELDFYIKNEVMRLDDIESVDAPKAEQYLAQIRVLRQIAAKLIDFLTQLESFQKRLWVKKKFVIDRQYCIALDRIPEEFYPEIAANDAQREEWVQLFAIDEIGGDLVVPAYSTPLTVDFLKANSKLLLDTRHFSSDFVSRLEASMEGLESSTDGLLVRSENSHALSLLKTRYGGDVTCVYIDPPYNSDAGPISYKNGYRHSSWIALVADGLVSAKCILGDSGILCVTIDDYEAHHLRVLCDSVFSSGELLGVAPIKNNPAGRTGTIGFSVCHEYAFFYGMSEAATIDRLEHSEAQKARYGERDEIGCFEWTNFRKHGGLNTFRQARPRQFYPIYVHGDHVRIPRMTWDNASRKYAIHDEPTAEEEVLLPIDEKGRERIWDFVVETAIKNIQHFRVRKDSQGKTAIYRKWRLNEEGILPKTWWDKSEYSAAEYGTNLLTHMFGSAHLFMFPKSVHAVADCLKVSGLRNDLGGCVLDFFAGSGTTAHAVILLNRVDGGSRKYVLVESAEYADLVTLARVKKAAYAREWADGKPITRDSGISHMFKYIRLESYEDCLNNLELKDDPAREESLSQNSGLREDYMLHYVLDVETRHSASLLNIDWFADPTAYKLKVKRPGSDEYDWRNVDLLETFNYLIGMRVEHIAAPQAFTAQFDREKDPDLPKGQLGRLVLKGRLKQDPNGPWWFRKVEGWVPKNPRTPNDGQREKVLIVWRKLTGDIERDNLVLDEWFRKYQINPRESYDYDVIYVNGSNNLPNLKLENETWRVRLIEEDFHRLMWDIEEI